MLADDIAAALPEMRAEAEARMLDTFDIKLSLGVGYDPEQDADVEQFEFLFTTPGRVKVTGNVVRDTEVGGRTSAVTSRELSIPVNSPVIPTNAVAVCVAADDLSDPTLLGAILRLDGPAPGSQVTARRLHVSEVVS